MLLRRSKTPEEKISADRQKIISYKKFFGTDEGREVLFDLMNRYHILNGHGGDMHKEGQRSVVLEIMRLANIDLAQFDKLLKGEIA